MPQGENRVAEKPQGNSEKAYRQEGRGDKKEPGGEMTKLLWDRVLPGDVLTPEMHVVRYKCDHGEIGYRLRNIGGVVHFPRPVCVLCGEEMKIMRMANIGTKKQDG
jgi:hypothetical protein